MKNSAHLILLACIVCALPMKSLMGSPLDGLKSLVYKHYGYTAEEKSLAHRQLLTLEKEAKSLHMIYQKRKQDAITDAEKAIVQDEFNKKVEDVSKQIDKQKHIIAPMTISQEKLLWDAAKIIGGATLGALFSYNVFAVPQLPQKESIAAKVVVKTTEAVALPKPPLTSQEIALYQLRYKNLSNAALWGILSTTAGLLITGPIGLPIDVLLYTIPTVSAAGALYYKKQLKSNLLP